MDELKKSGEIKGIARQQLSQCWAECVSILLIELGMVVVFVLSLLLVTKFCYSFGIIDFDIDHIVSQGTLPFFISVVIAVAAASILVAPLSYGINWFYMQAVLGRKAPASSFFACYTNKTLFKRVMKLHGMVSLRKFLMFVPLSLLIIAELVFMELVLKKTEDSFIYSVIVCCFILISAGAMFVYILVTMRYGLVKFIYALDPEKPAEHIIKESAGCIAGNESYILEIFLSVGLWVASCIMIFPVVYAVPYIKMTAAVAAKDLIDYNGDTWTEKKRSGNVKEENIFV